MMKQDERPFKSPLKDLIDDATYARFDKRKSAGSYDLYLGEGKKAATKKKARQQIGEKIKRKEPGFALRETALQGAARLLHGTTGPDCPGPNKPNFGARSWNKVSKDLMTPEELGVPRHEGDPQENARIIRRVARQFGASRVGVTGLDKRHVYLYDCDGKEIVFEPVDQPYENETKRVIPEKCRYTIVMLVSMPAEAFACAPFPVASMVPVLSYNRMEQLTGAVAEFIRGLGYVAIPSLNDTAVNAPFALEAGLGEICRMDKIMHPEFGPLVRISKVFTDLPLELDRPKKFGIVEFCKECRRCADVCPVKAINMDREPSFEVPGGWVCPGHKTWHGDNPKCCAYMDSTGGGCGICMNACPWNKPNGVIHSLVRAINEKTSRFDRFFVAADKILGYGKLLRPEKWWEMDLPIYGIDTRR
jgi:epoxyqueuosine reductase